ncbi:SDR family oxidoreductase [Plantactinospora sp. KLBMP9567]|uniref:SDR family oxidoreductase n=1 Tax=Plantactinospora sp. KLBMP9567 TaxID=3085900 RepID=UPI0029818A27|nr:SDR family oxidoreductase [Plantactinospora sp. KLBMP9567]MDW5328361.1 SDR family oxidoreductase [Plantactinospora sp. KLBMP9567]
MPSKQSRVAVVTGGSRGIGRAVALRLAADGQDVVVGYADNETEAKSTVAAIETTGGRAVAVQVDVADENGVTALFDTAERSFGGVDVVVNAAGVMILKPVAQLDLDEFDRMHRTNLRGAFVVAREATSRLRAGGAIINLSTSVTRLNLPSYAAYAASKAAVGALSPILAKELRGRDITVNAVAPGPTATALFLEGKSDDLIQSIAKQNPMERLGRPDDIAEVVSLLAGHGRWINGQTIFVNGGAA